MSDGKLFVAFERDSSTGTGQDVVVATRLPGDDWRLDVVATTSRTSSLDVRIRSEGNRLTLQWTHGDQLLALSEFSSGRWIAPDDTSDLDPGGIATAENDKDRFQGR